MERKADSCLEKQNKKQRNYTKFNLLKMQEMEQKRISNELHDTTVQNLTMLIHKAELCEQLADRDVIRTKLELQTMKETLRTTIQELRNIIYNLRPMSVDDLGLTDTIERFVSKKEFEDHPLKINLEVVGEESGNIKSVIVITLLRVVQELYHNAEKHARCKNFKIIICFHEEKIVMQVKDDGIGFSVDEIFLDDKKFGISIIQERIALLSGKIVINSEKGKGTHVRIEVPIEQEEKDAD